MTSNDCNTTTTKWSLPEVKRTTLCFNNSIREQRIYLPALYISVHCCNNSFQHLQGVCVIFQRVLVTAENKHTHSQLEIQCLAAFMWLYGCKLCVCVCVLRRKGFSYRAILMLICWCSSCRAPPFSSGLICLPPLKVFVLCFYAWGCTA